MSEWYEIDAAWDVNGYASDALLKLGETREWSDLVDEVAKLTHATAEEAWDGMAAAVRGYLESLDGQDVTDDIGRVTESPEMLHDTREKLEADVREEVGHYFAWQEKRDQFADKIVEWLDRQAAITARSIRDEETVKYWVEQYDKTLDKRDELKAKLDQMTVERDILQDCVDDLNADTSELQAKVVELTSELTAARNAHAQAEHEAVILREKLGRMLDNAHEITRIGGDC